LVRRQFSRSLRRCLKLQTANVIYDQQKRKTPWKFPATLALLIGAGLLAGCHSAPGGAGLQRFEFQQPHMGTLFTLTLYAPDEAKAREGAEAASAKIAALEKTMTDYDPGSELMQLCRRPVGEPTRVSDELFDILEKSQRVSELSDGAFDVTVGPLVRQWRRARRTGALPPPEAIARARDAVGWRKLKLDARRHTVTLTVPNMQLDLGGIAKGYAADKALAVLKHHGITRALVAASGDIAVSDAPPGQRGWRVGIGAPDSDPARSRTNPQPAGAEAGAPLVRRLLLKNAAVSTSGDAEQNVEIDGKRYSHIVDPHTGVGLTNRVQASIISRWATDTDAFATATSVLGVQRGLALVETQPGLGAIFVYKREGHLEVRRSKRFSSEYSP
jgi:thiamine biosynthesis lipoprotein